MGYVTILDRNLAPDQIKIIKNTEELLGFIIRNKTEIHLFIEPVFENGKLTVLIIR